MPYLSRQLTILPVMLNGALAYTTFTPNCSVLEHPVNFVNSADGRDTLSVLWSCLFTILACTWTILHLNVPEQRDSQDPGWRGDLKWTLKGAWTKTKWMLITMLAPELLLSIAVGNLAHAKEEKHKLGHFIDYVEVPWSLTHSMFVDMGGFVLRAIEGGPETNANAFSETFEPPGRSFFSRTNASAPANLGSTSGNYTNLEKRPQTSDTINLASPSQPASPTPADNGQPQEADDGQEHVGQGSTVQNQESKVLQDSIVAASQKPTPVQGPGDSIKFVEHEHSGGKDEKTGFEAHPSWCWCCAPPCYHLTASQLFMLRNEGHLERLPSIATQEIDARSKSDSFSKTIAMVQIFWNALQIIVRGVRGLAISQLELAVAAFSLCGILIYAFSWSKPKDAQVPITIKEYHLAIPDQLIDRLDEIERNKGKCEGLVGVFSVPWRLRNEVYRTEYGCRIPNDTCWIPLRDFRVMKFSPSRAELANHVGLLIGGLLFGAVHIIAWNFSFPTEIERILWRAASVFCAAVPPLTYTVVLLLILAQNIPFVLRLGVAGTSIKTFSGEHRF